jgi:hypothetical protein
LDRMLLVHDWCWLMWLRGSYNWDLLSFLRGGSLCTKPQRWLISHLLATSCRRWATWRRLEQTQKILANNVTCHSHPHQNSIIAIDQGIVIFVMLWVLLRGSKVTRGITWIMDWPNDWAVTLVV